MFGECSGECLLLGTSFKGSIGYWAILGGVSKVRIWQKPLCMRVSSSMSESQMRSERAHGRESEGKNRNPHAPFVEIQCSRLEAMENWIKNSVKICWERWTAKKNRSCQKQGKLVGLGADNFWGCKPCIMSTYISPSILMGSSHRSYWPYLPRSTSENQRWTSPTWPLLMSLDRPWM